MRFGCCTTIEHVRLVADAGYDYIELPTASVKALEPEAEFLPLARQVSNAPLVPEGFNIFLPGGIAVTGPDADPEQIRNYVETAMSRIHRLGGSRISFGSGAARRIPDGWDAGRAFEQIREFLDICGESAASNDIILCIEALNKTETNTINSIPEALRLAQAVDHPNVQILADYYHMMREGEPLEVVQAAGKAIKHTHVADGDARLSPGRGDYDFEAFFSALLRAGYGSEPTERCSIECRWENLQEELVPALATLRVAWMKALEKAT